MNVPKLSEIIVDLKEILGKKGDLWVRAFEMEVCTDEPERYDHGLFALVPIGDLPNHWME